MPEDAAFCPECGAEIPPAAAPAADVRKTAPSARGSALPDEGEGAGVVPTTSSESADVGLEGFEILQAALSSGQFHRNGQDFPVAPAPARAVIEGPDVPFDFEWDNAREFIEGVECYFAFRVRVRAKVESLTVTAIVRGETLAGTPFGSLCEGAECEGRLPFVPRMAGGLSVRLRAEVRYRGGCRETFESTQPFEHKVSPFRRYLTDGGQNVNIDIRDNSGLIRLDELKLPRQASIDLKVEIDRALSHRDGWRKVNFASCEIGSEVVNLYTGERVLTVVSGATPVSFGRSSRRATVRLVAENADGQIDTGRNRFISGVHFTLVNRASSVILRDGGSEETDGRKSWRKSSNGVSFNGKMISFDQKLPLGRTAQVVLAPYVISGGALALALEPRGRTLEIAGCDQTCELASVTIRRDDAPNHAILVVWGAAPIGDLLGPDTGLWIGLVHGRLRLIRRGGSSERLLHLVGKVVPGTDIYVQ